MNWIIGVMMTEMTEKQRIKLLECFKSLRSVIQERRLNDILNDVGDYRD